MKRIASVLCAVALVSACSEKDGPFAGGRCSYDSIPGTAVIRDVYADTAPSSLCDDAVVVLFDFIPDDPAAPQRYLFPESRDTDLSLHVGDGKNPPLGWVEAEGVLEGTAHRCARLEISEGACTPVLFPLAVIDYESWIEYCHTTR